MPIKPLPLDPQDIIRRYQSGENVLAMQNATGICRARLTRILKGSGIVLRSPRERLTAWHAKATPEDRMQRAQAAHAAVRGKPHTAEHRRKIALGRHAVPSNVSRTEGQLADALRAAGLAVEAQWPVGPYNLDLAVPSDRVSVEVFGGQWHLTGTHALRLGKRHEHLIGAGWRVIYVWCTTGHPLTAAGAENLVALVKLFCDDPSTGGKYRVIWGDAKGTPSAKYDPNQIALKAESERGQNITR